MTTALIVSILTTGDRELPVPCSSQWLMEMSWLFHVLDIITEQVSDRVVMSIAGAVRGVAVVMQRKDMGQIPLLPLLLQTGTME